VEGLGPDITIKSFLDSNLYRFSIDRNFNFPGEYSSFFLILGPFFSSIVIPVVGLVFSSVPLVIVAVAI